MLDSPYHGAPAMMTTQRPATLVNGSHSYNELTTLMKYRIPVSLPGLDGEPYLEGILTGVEHHGLYAHISIKTQFGAYNDVSLGLSHAPADEKPIWVRPGSERDKPRPKPYTETHRVVAAPKRQWHDNVPIGPCRNGLRHRMKTAVI